MSRFARLGPTAQGILLLLVAVMILSSMDVMAKEVGQRTNPIMATWARYVGQMAVVFVVVIPRMPQVFRTRYPGLQFLRSLFLLAATLCFFFSITLIGLAGSTAVMNTSPVLIALGAALFLKERFGPRRVFGVVAALAGALIVIRPGSAVFSVYSLLPLVSAVSVAGYSLATRFVGRGEDVWTSLFYAATFGSAILCAVVPFYWITPSPGTVGLMVAMGLAAALGHLCLIRAYMVAEAAAIAPFTYAQLLFATLWGMVFFAEVPDRWTVLGSLVIVGAGVYVWHRETRTVPPR